MNYEKLLDYAKTYYAFTLDRRNHLFKKSFSTFNGFILFISVGSLFIIFNFLIDGYYGYRLFESHIYYLIIVSYGTLIISFILLYLINHVKSTDLMTPQNLLKKEPMISVEEILKRYPLVPLDTLNMDEKAYLTLIHEYDKKNHYLHINIDQIEKLYTLLFIFLALCSTLMITVFILMMQYVWFLIIFIHTPNPLGVYLLYDKIILYE